MMKLKINDCFKIINNEHFNLPLRTLSSNPKKRGKILTTASMNQQIIQAQFELKGSILERAMKHKDDMVKGKQKPFKELIFTNLGDPHAMGQTPITFLRQVLALCVYPKLFNLSSIPDDVKERARAILDSCFGHSMGAYTDSQGMLVVRQHIAEFITKRDIGIECDPNNLFIQDGATAIIKLVLSLLCKDVDGKPSGVMMPLPINPLYSAVLTELKLHPVFYYLQENKNWSIDTEKLAEAKESMNCECNTRAILVINPGNPTGQVLPRKSIEDIIKFANKEKLVILADEVYQDNIYDETADFHSFKKVKHEMGPPYDQIELASFLSVSKGYIGETGLRGGCAELDGFDPDVQAMLVKSTSVQLCSNTVGQAALSILAKPPEYGDQSYEQFMREKCCILNELAAKARLLVARINNIPGLKVNNIQGALYALVKINMPEAAIKEAKLNKISPDLMWCSELLDSKGIVVVPGSGFGLQKDSYYFRTTILPTFEKLEDMIKAVKEFQKKFLERYGEKSKK